MESICVINLFKNEVVSYWNLLIYEILNNLYVCMRGAGISLLFYFSCSVPALPVKNLTGSGPVHPALAG